MSNSYDSNHLIFQGFHNNKNYHSKLAKMCHQIIVERNYGYSETVISDSICYSCNNKCFISEEKTINVVCDFKNNNSLVISGLSLYLPLYLSAALNSSLKFLPVVYKQVASCFFRLLFYKINKN